jgi:hypothetical protein
MANETWLERLQSLAARFSPLGIEADLAALTVVELWGVYRLLDGLAGGAQ